MASWQSRLQAKQNRLNQKLLDNMIHLSGDATDVVVIRSQLNMVGDVESRFVDYIDTLSIMLDPLEDVPLKVFSLNNPVPSPQATDGVSEKIKPLFAYAPIAAKVDQDDLIVKFIENPTDIQPWILVLQVKDALGTFGNRSIQWKKLKVTYYDNVIPTVIRNYVVELARRREILGW